MLLSALIIDPWALPTLGYTFTEVAFQWAFSDDTSQSVVQMCFQEADYDTFLVACHDCKIIS